MRQRARPAPRLAVQAFGQLLRIAGVDLGRYMEPLPELGPQRLADRQRAMFSRHQRAIAEAAMWPRQEQKEARMAERPGARGLRAIVAAVIEAEAVTRQIGRLLVVAGLVSADRYLQRVTARTLARARRPTLLETALRQLWRAEKPRQREGSTLDPPFRVYRSHSTGTLIEPRPKVKKSRWPGSGRSRA